MNKNLIPKAYCKNVFELDIEDLEKRQIRGLFFDIDNTLAPFGTDTPTPEAYSFFKKLKSLGFIIAIISNAGNGRSARYAKAADLYFTGRAHKPSVKGFERTCEKLKLLPGETAMIGDQLFTDIKGGNKFGSFTVLVKPVDLKTEPFYTKIKRPFERMVLKKLGVN